MSNQYLLINDYRDKRNFSHHHPMNTGHYYPSRTIVHPKLEMTEPGDHDEQEANAIAEAIAAGGKISRKISGENSTSGINISHQMESQLNQLQGGGQAMPTGLRNMMERGFGKNFSHVRLHTDSEAATLSSNIHAKAFTHDNDIFFNQGQFSPNTSEGQKLMAHELAHVVQGGGKVARDEFDDLSLEIPNLCLNPDFINSLPLEFQLQLLNDSLNTCPRIEDLQFPPHNLSEDSSNKAFQEYQVPPVKDTNRLLLKGVAKGLSLVGDKYSSKEPKSKEPKSAGESSGKEFEITKMIKETFPEPSRPSEPTKLKPSEPFYLNKKIGVGKEGDYYFLRYKIGDYYFDLGHTKDITNLKEFMISVGVKF